ncbi:MAG TPA: hypothetical protein VFH61_01220, partial [Thermoleophilia bacterium]|nr:hypothetical protein [Thermoleophilia bacterium]
MASDGVPPRCLGERAVILSELGKDATVFAPVADIAEVETADVRMVVRQDDGEQGSELSRLSGRLVSSMASS